MVYYYKAYYLKDLRAYTDWNEDIYKTKPETEEMEEWEAAINAPLKDNTVVYLREDYKVSTTIFDDGPWVFDNVTDNWKTFCTKNLEFDPKDYDK